MSHKRVAIIRGGPSREYDVSMRSGSAIVKACRELGYTIKDVVITRAGDWLEGGIVRAPQHILSDVDIVFIALHGAYGEDGEIQKILHRLHIPYTGSRPFPSARAFNKQLTKDHLKAHGVKVPAGIRVTRTPDIDIESLIKNLNGALGNELFIKPVAEGSSIGAEYIPSIEHLRARLPQLLENNANLLVEEYLRGREATVGILEGFRGERTYVLPVVEIVPPRKADFYSNEYKYNGLTKQFCPARFSYSEKQKLADLAAAAHELLELTQYSRADFILSNGEIYFLETNTLPGFTEQSNFPLAAAAVGLSFNDLVDYLIKTARVT